MSDVSAGVLRGVLAEGPRDGPPHVALRSEYDDVDLGRQETRQQHSGADTDGETQRGETHFNTTRRAHVYRYKRQPHNTRRVHGQTDVFRLVERLRYVPGEHGVDCAYDDEDARVGEADNVLLTYAR